MCTYTVSIHIYTLYVSYYILLYYVDLISLLFLLRWTGSNTNPNNNDGQGRAGTDRSNMVLLRNQNYPEGTPGVAVPTAEKRGHFGNSYPQHLNHSEKFLDLNMELRGHLAMLTPGNDD